MCLMGGHGLCIQHETTRIIFHQTNCAFAKRYTNAGQDFDLGREGCEHTAERAGEHAEGR